MDASAVAAPAGLRRPARLLRLASDEQLVAYVRAGDEGAFEAIYDRHHGAILGFCRHMLGTREEAEDALQHTFLAAYRDLTRSTKPIELRPWLFTIARNRCLSLLRMRRPQVALEDAEPATEGLPSLVERREDVRELLADLAQLPEDQRAALLLAELGALDHAGIATVLGCPREKVKALVFQARSSLAASREARATPCEQIRMELATASGAALRRGPLRRHLRTCDGCRAFKAEVETQRKLLALALPVVPGVALKAGVLAGAFGAGAHGVSGAAGAGVGGAGAAGAGSAGAVAGGSGGAGALGGVLTAVASTGAVKAAVAVAVAAAVAGGGGVLAPRLLRHDGAGSSTAGHQIVPSGAAASGAALGGSGSGVPASASSGAGGARGGRSAAAGGLAGSPGLGRSPAALLRSGSVNKHARVPAAPGAGSHATTGQRRPGATAPVHGRVPSTGSGTGRAPGGASPGRRGPSTSGSSQSQPAPSGTGGTHAPPPATSTPPTSTDSSSAGSGASTHASTTPASPAHSG